MRDLNFDLLNLCRHNLDGSHQTQANRKDMLQLIAHQLHELGYRKMKVISLKPKHVEALVARWKSEKISIGTIKNRMAALRWWARKINKAPVVAKDNRHYGIENRQYVTNVSKAQSLTKEKLNAITDPYVRCSLKLQEAFGLRREEAIKFVPAWADRGDCIELKPTWTKGGRARSAPIRNEYQRQVLNEAKRLAGKGSLIPSNKNYIQQLRVYENQTYRAGLSNMHGLRHLFAQTRYEELTGRKAPALGGDRPKTAEERRVDKDARLTISQELGHEREAITAIYLGR